MRVVTILGTRPEIIRLAPTLKRLDAETSHTLVHTGQNYDYELNQIFFEDLGLSQPEHYLDAVGVNLGETMGKIIAKSYELLNEIKPDCILTLGDTNSCLSVISAKRLKIPIFHVEAGNRCYDVRVPEEINRRIVDHTSDINLTYSERARENLIREGLSPDRVFKIGSPILELYSDYHDKIENSRILSKLEISKKNYFVVSFHREENVENDKTLDNFCNLLKCIHEKYDKKIVISLHPRARKALGDRVNMIEQTCIVLKPLSYTDYVSLQKNSYCTLSDSGTITEEATVIGFPAINLRHNQERHEGMDTGGVIMTGVKPKAIMSALEVLERQGFLSRGVKFETPNDYSNADFSKKIIRLIHSYTPVINNYTWFKDV